MHQECEERAFAAAGLQGFSERDAAEGEAEAAVDGTQRPYSPCNLTVVQDAHWRSLDCDTGGGFEDTLCVAGLQIRCELRSHDGWLAAMQWRGAVDGVELDGQPGHGESQY